MGGRSKRSLITDINRFQQQILFPVLLASILVCGVLISSLAYVQHIDEHLALYCSSDTGGLGKLVPWFMDVNQFRTGVPWIMITIVALLSFVILHTLYFSHRLLGAYNRVLQEMDDILAGKFSNR